MPSFPLSLSQWKYRIPLTINGSLIDANLTDFPVLVKLNSSRFNFSKARSDGFDLRFALPDGTLLKYERERHDANNQVAEYWVKIPSVLSGQNTTFYLYFSNSSAPDGADPTNVWDSNFVAVYHLQGSYNGTSGEVKDSTANPANGTGGGGNTSRVPTQSDAKIGKGQYFDGTDDYIDFDNPTKLQLTGALTAEVWIKMPSPPSSERHFFAKSRQDTNQRSWWLSFHGTSGQNKFVVARSTDGTWTSSTYEVRYGTTTPSANTWYYVVGVLYNDGSTHAKLYVNGVLENGTTEGAPRTVTNNTPVQMTLARSEAPYEPPIVLQCYLDEARLSNIPRSAAWIKASYHSGNDSLISYGAEEKRSSIIPLIFIR
jgi:hypothetical protein